MTANILVKLELVKKRNKMPFIFCIPDWSYLSLKKIRPRSTAIILNSNKLKFHTLNDFDIISSFTIVCAMLI